ncbi:hypothetical protein BU24DRAFT_343565 [Aaosphaeria arxii CBS 175.79]|uniref:N-acetyltransferase domain-containing protein n=1 Tax=Aaosphaeria arxii CBS 175.79 TaxID=1450172 RepID=A0A6A5XXF6_9PLEO|nr:uncharacterized protein BU24DRAFT_343565 [Aaosphaeria arxii CBS 175.79]KAF2017330.1 hypothetical protein BU24DRAFT_343565 [Aaosphaeria arxii CBS 175.79]
MTAERLGPEYENIRLARLSDLPRIAVVAAAGFYHSPTFRFQRPLHNIHNWSQDTVLSYWNEYREEIHDPASVVLVVEDNRVETEQDHAFEALRASSLYSYGWNSDGAKTIVGVCGIDLKPGSSRIGEFQPEKPPQPKATCPTVNRDMSPEALHTYSLATAGAKARYLEGHMRLSTLAVHPAYWRRGHATRLVNWCTSLADREDTQVGISAAPMGATVAAKAGFEERELITISATDVQRILTPATTVGEVTLWIAVRRPSRSPSDAGTLRSNSSASASGIEL